MSPQFLANITVVIRNGRRTTHTTLRYTQAPNPLFPLSSAAMSWFSSSTSIDAEVERATDESIPFGETDLAASLEVADLIRSKKVTPKDAMRSLKKRLTATKNPNTQLSTLHLIDTCVKNGGAHFIQEMASREFMDSLVSLVHEDKTNESVRDLALELIQSWATAFKDNSSLKYVGTTYRHLQDDGYSFPSNTTQLSSTLFDSSAPPEWEDSDACMICSTPFTMINRKHHCRNCGGVYCQSHSSKSMSLPHLGITEPVRVCDSCYDEIRYKKKSSKKHRRSKHDKDVSRARAQYDSDDDDDLKRALELSLKESQGYVAPPEPVKQVAVEDEDDAEMKAAIAASLREFEQEKHRTEQQQQSQPATNVESPYSNLIPQAATPYQTQQLPESSQIQQQYSQVQYPAQFPNVLPNYITQQDESSIEQFASKVEEFKVNPQYGYDNPELVEHYRQAIPLVPKLATDLNDSLSKHDQLVSMNQKIDTIMKMYNTLLDRRIERETLQRQQYSSVPSYPPQSYNYQQHQQPVQHSPQQQYSQPYENSPQLYQTTSSIPQPTYQPQVQPHSQPTESPYPTNSYPEPEDQDSTQQQHEHQQQQVPQETPSYPPSAVDAGEEFSAPPSVISPQNTTQQNAYPLEPLQQQQQQQTPVASPSQPQHTQQQSPEVPRAKITDFSFPNVPVNRPPPVVSTHEQANIEVPQPKEEALIEL